LGATAALAGGVDAQQQQQCSLQTLQRLNTERLDMLRRRTESLTPAHVDACRRAVAALGFATHTAQGHESEAVCAALVRQGVADATCSEDLDVLAFGGRRLLRGFYAPSAAELMLIDADRAHADLGLTRGAFVDLCILCGTDFSATLEGVGPVTALRLVRRFGSIERIVDANPALRPRPGFCFQDARAIFLQDIASPFLCRAQVAPRRPLIPPSPSFDPFASPPKQ
ncbi:hypothetical protein GGI04_006083, partial [Coemansia thaxteri]